MKQTHDKLHVWRTRKKSEPLMGFELTTLGDLLCIDKQCKEVSSAVMALTVMFNKAYCEIFILSISLFTLLKSLTFQLTTERLNLHVLYI